MSQRWVWKVFAVGVFACSLAWAEGQVKPLPAPAQDMALARSATPQTAVFAGGCFWGMEAVFEHVTGVVGVVSGYAGGEAQTANYEAVSGGKTGHAEAVRITYDPAQITYGQLLEIFFAVAHDPTQWDRQGPDTGPQYRSEIFTTSTEQARIAQGYIAQLTRAQVYAEPIVTRVSPLPAFYEAEAYHQDFAAHHPNHGYILRYDRPKVEHLKQAFPARYREE